MAQKLFSDAVFGEHLRAARNAAGMTQQNLADRMAGYGYQMHRSAIAKTEAGERPVSFAEAFYFARILQIPLDRFTWTSAEARAMEAVYAAGARLRQHFEIVADAAVHLLRFHDAAARILEMHESSEHASVQDAREDVAARMRMYGLDRAVAEGVSRYEEQSETTITEDDQ